MTLSRASSINGAVVSSVLAYNSSFKSVITFEFILHNYIMNLTIKKPCNYQYFEELTAPTQIVTDQVKT